MWVMRLQSLILARSLHPSKVQAIFRWPGTMLVHGRLSLELEWIGADLHTISWGPWVGGEGRRAVGISSQGTSIRSRIWVLSKLCHVSKFSKEM